MSKARVAWILMLCLVTFPPLTSAAERVRFATNAMSVRQLLPVLAAQEQKTWQKYGLDAEWFNIRGAASMYRAAAAGQIDAGTGGAIGMMTAIARGVPLVIVVSTGEENFFMWVSVKGPIAAPKDLRGAKIAVTSLGGSIHAFSQAVVKSLGLEKEVKFVATGGPRESLAAIKTGSAEAYISSFSSMVKLKLAGEFKEVLSVSDYLPKEFADGVIFVRKGLLREEGKKARKLALALRDAINFIRANPAWALQKLESQFGQSALEAKLILENIRWPADGKITAAEVEGVKKFAIQYGLAKAEEFPPLSEYFVPILEQ